MGRSFEHVQVGPDDVLREQAGLGIAPVALLGKPTKVMKSVVITADTRSSADVWLILNNTDVGQITSGDALNPQEIFHIAHLVGSWNTSLGDNFPVVLPPDITL